MVKNEYKNLKFKIKRYQPYQLYDKIRYIHGDIDLNDARFNHYCLEYLICKHAKFSKIHKDFLNGLISIEDYDELRDQFMDAVYESNPWLENLDY